MTTLISFLGKGRLDAQRTGYQETTYRFSADFARSVAWFGLALAEHLKPQRLILVGTRGACGTSSSSARATTTTKSSA